MDVQLIKKLVNCGLVAICIFTINVVASPNFEYFQENVRQLYSDLIDSRGDEVLVAWQALLSSSSTQTEEEKLRSVNNFFNKTIFFANDQDIWQKNDYWASPVETMLQQRGDCEDFSIAKYVTLVKLGIKAEKLRMVYVKARISASNAQAHMVLAYYPAPLAEPLILDNLNFLILPASKRPDLKPVFSFNSEGLWMGSSQQPKVKRAETRLSSWRDVLVRMQSEGLYEINPLEIE